MTTLRHTSRPWTAANLALAAEQLTAAAALGTPRTAALRIVGRLLNRTPQAVAAAMRRQECPTNIKTKEDMS